MINNQKTEVNNKEASTDKNRISAPSISLPKGGGAIGGIGEKFSANPVTGTGSLSVPIFTTPGRSDFYPKLSLSYDSGSGNGPFGLGWDLSIPSITRKTEKGLPRYWDAEDSDTFILSGAEDLVPAMEQKDNDTWEKVIFPRTVDSELYTVQRYRPRIEGLFARIEKWTHKETGDVHWESVTKDNVKSVYGRSSKDTKGRIADPEDPSRIFKWLLEESYDDKGNVIVYEYRQENADNVPQSWPQEKNRLANGADFANRYLKHVKYGNKTPFQRSDWLFQVVFDYGEHDADKPEIDNEVSKWPPRRDAFSSYKATFEIRTYRLCRRVLMFHHFAELGNTPCLVRSTDFKYNDSDPIQGPVACYLTSVTQTGYIRDEQTGNYQKKSFPSLEFAYNERTVNEEIRVSDADSMENLPIGLDGARYQWVDLDGEGISGILTEQADAWFYKRNLGNAEFGPAQAMPPPPPLPPSDMGNVRFTPIQVVSTRPSVANLQGGQQQFMDLAGDGQLDLVQFSDPLPGYYERDDAGGWGPFIPFEFSPNISWNDPNLKFIELTGDGQADILISEHEVFVWYPSRAEEGFGPAEVVRKPFDEEKGPALAFADATQSVYLADMSGDGLTDIARIRNGEACYWPNLGYGRFGAKVIMDNAPYFDHPEYFNPDRIRLADIDGSGTTDIIYFGRDTITFWFNQAGNSWSEPHRLSNFPPTDNLSSVTVVDLLGNGTACIVWSSPLPSANGHPMQYIDLMGGVKPHLLRSTTNNMGAETRVRYASSTKYYLEDLVAGTPWITKLSFPVHAVERVETRDYVSNTKLVTLYKYHHGYYDGEEREFRGFGLAEQWDTEFFDQFRGNGLFDEEPDNSDEVFHQPPVYTKTWFHTGAFLDRDNISKHYVEEYYKGDSQATLLPDTILPSGLTNAKEEQEACRALKGSMLRQEIYTLDDSQESEHPYTVTETAYKLHSLQPRQDGHYAVFYSYQCEALSYHYERNPDDPRAGHAITLEVDDFGNVTKAVSVAYPRRNPQFAEQGEIQGQPGKGKPFITYTENLVTNKHKESDWYRIGVPIESRTYEITGLEVTGLPSFTPYTIDFIQGELRDATDIPYEEQPNGSLQKRLIERVKTIYRKNSQANTTDPNPLPLEEIDSMALPCESFKLAFTPGLLAQVFSGKVNTNDLATLLRNEGKYVEQDGLWWIPSGRQAFDPAQFYLPIKVKDPFGQIFASTYDDYALLITKTEDPLKNVIEAVNDYRVMQPKLMTDPNDNHSAVAFDALGMVVVTAVMGKAGETDPAKMGDTLGDPTTKLEYELFNWKDNQEPNFIHTFAREKHGAANPRWQESYTYSDGFGREIQTKVQAEPELVDGTFVSERWAGTGWTIFNNKGEPVKKYEPFFSDTHEFEFAKQVGVSSTLFYDSLERVVATLHPNNTYEKVVFDPWQQTTWDMNDTVSQSDPKNDPDVGGFFRLLDDSEYLPIWYDQRKSGGLGQAEKDAADKAAKHANTPTTAYLDTLGRTFLTIARNGLTPADEYRTHVEMDIEGNQRSVTDALKRKVMTYDYDMLSNEIHQVSMDAGERWMLNDVAGKPLRSWDSRDHEFKYEYDELRRPAKMLVKTGGGAGQGFNVFEEIIYGEEQTDDRKLNLRGKPFKHKDTAGVVTNLEYDFKGNLLKSSRQLLSDYKQDVNWDTNPALESETFTSTTAFDALNRPILITTPHNANIVPSEIRPIYNEANLLNEVRVKVRGAAETAYVKNINYNAKGQRELIEYNNGVFFTEYTYDKETFRLIHLKTTRPTFPTDEKIVQDLTYTYDPIGNITHIQDNADIQNVVFFRNRRVEPSADCIYDALYRLIEAAGREHLGQINGQPNPPTPPDHFNLFHTRLDHPGDGKAMGTYVEKCKYDEVGNIKEIVHNGTDPAQPGWTRAYAYNEPSLIEPAKKNNRLSSTTVGGTTEHYGYDLQLGGAQHGFITSMSHLPKMEWDFEDQLQKVDLGGGGTAYYVYDAAGQRVRKVIERRSGAITKEERIYLGGFEIYRQYNGSGVKLERETLHIMDDKRRIAMVDTRTKGNDGSAKQLIRYQLDNYLGSASLELDDKGAVIFYEEYYPYGSTSYHAVNKDIKAAAKRYRYTGKERDEESGLYYHGARYYAPWLGRWLSCDPDQSRRRNLYYFADASPTKHIDHDGRQPTVVTEPVVPRVAPPVAPLGDWAGRPIGWSPPPPVIVPGAGPAPSLPVGVAPSTLPSSGPAYAPPPGPVLPYLLPPGAAYTPQTAPSTPVPGGPVRDPTTYTSRIEAPPFATDPKYLELAKKGHFISHAEITPKGAVIYLELGKFGFSKDIQALIKNKYDWANYLIKEGIFDARAHAGVEYASRLSEAYKKYVDLVTFPVRPAPPFGLTDFELAKEHFESLQVDEFISRFFGGPQTPENQGLMYSAVNAALGPIEYWAAKNLAPGTKILQFKVSFRGSVGPSYKNRDWYAPYKE